MKPRLVLMREGPARGWWRCWDGERCAGFGPTPFRAYVDWARGLPRSDNRLQFAINRIERAYLPRVPQPARINWAS